jgi:thiol-disulfide isomerase/thioredoxin
MHKPSDTPTIAIDPCNGYTLMQRTCLLKFLSLCFILTLSATTSIDTAYAVQDDAKAEIDEYSQQRGPQHLTGKITEIITAGGITYIAVDAGKEIIWAAGPNDNSLDNGDTISFSTAMPMQNFYSKKLDRDFSVIYFVKQFNSGDQAANAIKPSGQSNKPQAPHAAAPQTARTPGEVVVGNHLLNASLDGLNIKNKTLSEYKGKPLIINVWASWCGPCRAEMGSLMRLAERYNGKMFNIIGISTDDYRDKAVAFIEQTNISFDNYIDHELLLENMLGASTIPLTVLVDADGRVLQKVRGSREWDSPEIVKSIGKVFGIQLM